MFTDADTVFQPHALRGLVMVMFAQEAGLLTGSPRQKMESWGERMLVPFFLWAVMCFMPLWLAYRQRMPGLSAEIG